MATPNPMGSTFAERAAAAAGKKTFVDPTPDPAKEAANSTFADRAKAAGKGAKAVEADDDKAENKAVKSAAKKS